MPDALPEPLRAQRRRRRITYGAVVGAAVVAVALTMGLVIGTGEAAHATLATSAAAGPVPTGTVSGTPSVAWSTTDHPALGDPLWVGTVITWSDHQLSGRDATTGAVRWSYRRTDADICDAGQQNGQAFVLFRRDGNCDELSTFDSGTGKRGWFRTLPDDGTGRFLFGPAGLVVVYAASFHTIDAGGGIERYPSVTQPPGCLITSAADGQGGILLTQHCADGDHLVLYTNYGVSSVATTTFRVAVGSGVRALASDQFVATYDTATAEVALRTPAKGAVQPPPALSPAPGGAAGPETSLTSSTVLQIGSQLYALDVQGAQTWTLGDVRGPAEPLDSTAAALLVATATGADRVDATSGSVIARYRFTPPVDGSRVYAAGAGLIVAGSGLAYLR